jgi:hypothetical protein
MSLFDLLRGYSSIAPSDFALNLADDGSIDPRFANLADDPFAQQQVASNPPIDATDFALFNPSIVQWRSGPTPSGGDPWEMNAGPAAMASIAQPAAAWLQAASSAPAAPTPFDALPLAYDSNPPPGSENALDRASQGADILGSGDTDPGQEVQDPSYDIAGDEHTKGKRPSTQEKHEEGQARRQRDQGREKGDEVRRDQRRRPKGWEGSWPPRKALPVLPGPGAPPTFFDPFLLITPPEFIDPYLGCPDGRACA